MVWSVVHICACGVEAPLFMGNDGPALRPNRISAPPGQISRARPGRLAKNTLPRWDRYLPAHGAKKRRSLSPPLPQPPDAAGLLEASSATLQKRRTNGTFLRLKSGMRVADTQHTDR